MFGLKCCFLKKLLCMIDKIEHEELSCLCAPKFPPPPPQKKKDCNSKKDRGK